MLAIDQNLFNQNLLLTQAYCDLQLKNTYKNYASILRSFNPVYDGKELFSFKLEKFSPQSADSFLFMTEWGLDPFKNDLYSDLCERQLKHKNEIITEIIPMEHKGQILVADIDSVIMDGISEFESGGFIDCYDCPPIDTWFYMGKKESRRELFAWIPGPFIKNVDDGIDVNMLGTLNWYKEEGTESTNWHEENLGAAPKNAIAEIKSPDSFFEQIKKLFS